MTSCVSKTLECYRDIEIPDEYRDLKEFVCIVEKPSGIKDVILPDTVFTIVDDVLYFYRQKDWKIWTLKIQNKGKTLMFHNVKNVPKMYTPEWYRLQKS